MIRNITLTLAFILGATLLVIALTTPLRINHLTCNDKCVIKWAPHIEQCDHMQECEEQVSKQFADCTDRCK